MTSWNTLASLRKRGQRPLGPVYVTDDWRQFARLSRFGLFALPFRDDAPWPLLAGLWVLLYAKQTDKSVAAAARIAQVGPYRYGYKFRGRPWRSVIDPRGVGDSHTKVGIA